MTSLHQKQVLRARNVHRGSDYNVDQLESSTATTSSEETTTPPTSDGLEQEEAEGLEEECDDCPPLSGRTVGYWIALLFFVGPFYAIPPLSWAYTIYTAVRLWKARTGSGYLFQSGSNWDSLLLLYTGFECIFSIYYHTICWKVSALQSQVPKRDPAELRLAIRRLLEKDLDFQPDPSPPDSPVSPLNGEVMSGLLFPKPIPPPRLSRNDPRAIDFRNHFRMWFRGRPWRQISRQSMREWFAWSLFDARLEALDQTQQDMVGDAVALLECRAGCSLSDSEQSDDGVIRLTSDPIVMWSRPGLLYVLGGVMNVLSAWWLEWVYGMVKLEFEGIEYLIREGKPAATLDSKSASSYEPIILLHGLGFGLLQYVFTIVFFLNRIPSNQPLVVPLDPSISQSIWHPSHLEPMSRRLWVQGLKGLIEKQGWSDDGVTMISHSKGSYVHTWMLKDHPNLVKRSCFADPVCFCIWEGDLCWNFVYRAPRTVWQLVIKYFAATEPGISLAIQRHFDWVSNALWLEEIPNSTEPYYACFLLGALDVVINTVRVRRYLENHGIRDGVHWNPSGHHAEAAIGWTGLQNIVDWLLMPSPAAVSPRSST